MRRGEQPTVIARQLYRTTQRAQVLDGGEMQGIERPNRDWPRFQTSYSSNRLETNGACQNSKGGARGSNSNRESATELSM